MRRSLCLFLIALAPLAAAEKAAKPGADGWPAANERFRPKDVDTHLNLKYLPEWRYSGDQDVRRDNELVLDLWVPKGRDACPLVMYVHGGAYAEGSKALSRYSPLAERCLAKGIAFASLNYIMKPKGIRPQVWYDYRDAARFLRMHAKEFRLDPTKFGAFGISAGGWLITTAGHGTGDHYAGPGNGQGMTLYDYQHTGFAPKLHKDGEAQSVWVGMQSEHPGWPGVYGRWQAVAYDFSHFGTWATSGSPAMCDIVGDGMKGKPKSPPRFKPKYPPLPSLGQLVEEGKVDRVLARMTAPKFAGKGVHVPPIVGKPGASKREQSEHAMTKRIVGEGEAELADVLVEWYLDRLDGPNARAPVPEIWPAMRLVDGPTEVSIVVPDGVSVHYTTDGSEPTPSSKTYDAPFTVPPDTQVKAIGVMPERKPSGAAIASFVKGPVPPKLTTVGRDLPPAETGKPYTFTFQADRPGCRFWLKGDLVPHQERKTDKEIVPNGMRLDAKTGVWSGTPTRPGRFWIQVAVQEQPGMVARLHDFVWVVSGEATAGADAPAESSATDTHAEILTLPQLATDRQEALAKAAEEAGVDLVIQDTGSVMLLAPAKQAAQAKAFLKKFFGKDLPAGAEWAR